MGNVSLFKEFCEFLAEVRAYFVGQGFIETPTPTLVSCPGMEAHLDPVEITTGEFLPTSPEIHLKRLLCMGFEQIFEIRPCFRNDPSTDRHRREFMMLEWYRTQQNLSALSADIQGLLNHLKARQMWSHSTEIHQHTFKDLFHRNFNFEFRADTTLAELQNLFRNQQIHFQDDDSKEELIHRLMIDFFEPSFKGLNLLTDFPPEMAILSRIGPNGFAERFELYADNMELANAFHEVTDPKVQRERWKRDQQERLRLNAKPLQPDERLLKDMENLGLPPSAGIALGLDRLFMVSKGLKDISEIRPF